MLTLKIDTKKTFALAKKQLIFNIEFFYLIAI
jgi:hypothetical protein